MKQFIKSLLAYFFILFFVISMFNKGMILPKDTIYFIITLLVLTLTIMIVEPFLKFLTIKSNFLTFFIMSSLLLIGVFFLLKLFMTGFYINQFTFEGLVLGSIQIKNFIVSPVVTIVATSVATGLISSIYKVADSV